MRFLFTILILFPIFLFSQKEANVWYFGENAGLDFNTTPPTALTNGEISTDEGCSSFSDGNGNLLFYSDGIRVYNKNHELMTYSNGNEAIDLEGNPSSTQSGMIIPKPNSSTIYYLFTVGTALVPTGIAPNSGFNYYTIDISKNNGLGEIIDGPINLAINPISNNDLSLIWSEKVTAVKGKECNTLWVLSFTDNTFYAYKVNSNGVDNENVVISQVNFTSSDKRGYLQVSPDGKKIAFADFNLVSFANPPIINGSLVLFDFDDETGIVSANPSEILIPRNSNESPYGVAFSQQSNKLYASTYNGEDIAIHQFDLESTNIPQSKKTLTTINAINRGALQLAPDGKIYSSVPDKQFIDVIENPNNDNAIYIQNAISLNGKRTAQGLPPFIASLLLPITIHDNNTNESINNKDLKFCIGESLEIRTEAINGVNINYSWSFNNGIEITELTNLPNLTLNNLTPTNNGTYNLVVSLEDECGNQKTFEATFNLAIFEPTITYQPDDLNLCDLNEITPNIQTSIVESALAVQSNSSQFEVVFYSNLIDANNNTNPLSDIFNEVIAPTSKSIYIRIQNIEAPNSCFESTEFNINILSSPEPSQASDYIICDDDLNGANLDRFSNNFDLSSKDSEILNALDLEQFNISYHTTLIGAQTSNTSDAIPKNILYQNIIANEQVIYVRVENISNTNCFIVSENATDFEPFSLIVNPLPTIESPVQITQCDTDNDLATTINLTLFEDNISNDSNSFQYYPSQNDANLNTSEIMATTNHPVINGDTIWVRVTSDLNCFRIAELNIIVSPSGIINYNRNFTECDDLTNRNGNNSDEDGLTNFNISTVPNDVLNLFPDSENLNVIVFETIEDRDAVINPISDLTNYRNTNLLPNTSIQNLYFKVINTRNNNCEGLGQFTIQTLPLPSFNVTSPQILCLNNSPLTIEAENIDNSNNYSYEWAKNNSAAIITDTSNLAITSLGEYHITVINSVTQCKRTKTIIISESDIPTITNNDIIIIDDSDNNSIVINTENIGSGDYQYALFNEDNTSIVIDYQDEPNFENLEGGIYILRIRDKNGCGSINLPISIIEFPKFFTPNNDGFNDTFKIKGASLQLHQTSNIFIFNRFGKKIAETPIEGNGWNGTFNGVELPANDYWYSVQLTDINGNTRNKKGHFSLIRN